MDYKKFLFDGFPEILETIEPNTPALWGQMNVHQMIEHLALVMSIANGRMSVVADAPAEKLAYRKMRFFEKDIPFTHGIKLSAISENPVPTMFVDINQSKQFLLSQLERFFDYFNEHNDIMPEHPVFGPMNHEEWVQFQARHIWHHLAQFGIVEERIV